jgi:hypothetical protein
MRVLRSSLFVAATAIIAAACGDKVTQVTQTSNASITSVIVTPGTSTLTSGQTVTLTAAVNATAGVTPTITWTTSSSASASISATTGTSITVTAGTASPGVSICASATAAGLNTAVNCATVIVQPPTTVIPAVLQIASVTVAGSLNTAVATPPGVMAGQVNVSVNMNPGTEKMDSVVVQLNGKTAATQVFTSAQAAALRAATGSGADQALQSTIVFAVNTAAYNPTTGAVTFPNGTASFVVYGYGKQGGTPAVNSVTSQAYLLGNVDAWIVAQTLTGGKTANSATGFAWASGAVNVTAIPVLYSGLTISTATINYGSAACDASTSAQRTQPATAPAAGTFAWTASFANSSQAGPNSAGANPVAASKLNTVNSYEFNPAACVAANAAGGEGATVAAAQYANTNSAPVGFAAGSTIPVARLDNRGPGTPTLVQNPRIRQNGWINAQVGVLAVNNLTFTGSTANNLMAAGTADGGVGGYVGQIRVAASSLGATVDAALATAPMTAAAAAATGALSPSLTKDSYCGVWSATDLLGNESNLPASGAGIVCTPTSVASNTVTGPLTATNAQASMQFGVDIAPPTITMGAGSIAAGTAGTAVVGATVGTEFQVTVTDTGVVGNSGMQATAPVIGTVTIRAPASAGVLTAAQLCPVGTVASGVCTASATGIAAVAFPNVSTSTIAADAIVGYYTLTANSVDAAGNVSTGVATRVIGHDIVSAPALTGSVFTTPITGGVVTFSATGSDNFDLWNVGYTLTYGGGLAGPLLYPSTVINTFNAPTFVNTAVPVNITINNFMRQIEAQTSACNAPLTTGGGFKPTTLTETMLDMGSQTSGAIATAIPGGSVTTGVLYTAALAPQLTATSIVNNGVTGCPAGAAVNAPVYVSVSAGTVVAGTASPLSITLGLDAYGPTATYIAPFASVNFYALVGANLELLGTASSPGLVDNGVALNGRKYTYSFSWTPTKKSPVSATTWPTATAGACVAGTAVNIYAVGVNAAGDALVSPVNANVCIDP